MSERPITRAVGTQTRPKLAVWNYGLWNDSHWCPDLRTDTGVTRSGG